MFAGVEHQTDGEQVDFDVDDLAGREFIQARLLDGIRSRSVDDEDAALRAGLASSMLVGIVVGRRIVGVPILANAESETLITLVAPAIQSVLTAVEE
ncbi:MAG: hypothetical protein WBR28_18640 [Mycobacterium sp.]